MNCIKWCCYEDPKKIQCIEIVQKNYKQVQCKRLGIVYCKIRKGYFCEKHY